MKLFIGARCQATANESGVKPPHSKVTHGCNLQTFACRTHSLCAAAKRVHPTICLAINLIIGLGISGLTSYPILLYWQSWAADATAEVKRLREQKWL